MRRIHITGNAGSGKSTLAERLGRELDLPVFGLDSLVWQPGWRKSPPDWRLEKERELVDQPAWVIEGVSKTIRDAADVVIFLDVSRPVAYFRCARRNWRYLFRSRPGLPEDCPEILIIPRLAKIIWKFPKHMKPQIEADLAQSRAVSYRVKTRHDHAAVLEKLGVDPSRADV